MKKITRILLILLALSFASPGVRASSATLSHSTKFNELELELRRLTDAYIGTGLNPLNRPRHPSVVIAVVTPDTSEVLSYGKLPNGSSPTKKITN